MYLNIDWLRCGTPVTGVLMVSCAHDPFSSFAFPPAFVQFHFLNATPCVDICVKKYSGSDGNSLKRLAFLKKGISLDYQHHWYPISID